MPEVKEQPKTQEAPPAPKKSLISPEMISSFKPVGIYLAIGIVAVFAAFLLTTKVLKPMVAEGPRGEVTKSAEVSGKEPDKAKAEPKKEVAHAESKPKTEGNDGGHGGEVTEGNGNYYNIESVVVNPAGTQGTRFLSCGVSFELASGDEVKAFESQAIRIKDLLITVLSSKTVDELSDVQERNKMRRQMLTIVNRMMTPVEARAVFLTDFVLQ